MLVEARRAIIVCYGLGNLIEDVLDRLAMRPPPWSSSQLLPAVVVALVKPLEPKIIQLTDPIDALEDDVMGTRREGLARRVIEAGRQVLSVRRYLEPMEDELQLLDRAGAMPSAPAPCIGLSGAL